MSSGRRGGGRGGNRGQWRGGGSRGSREQAPVVVNPDNPILCQFQTFAASLDHRHDKRERLVKLSRDVTIESKRIIFLLHRVNLTSGNDDEDNTCIDQTEENLTILSEAESRLSDIETNLWSLVAEELKEEDPWFYLRAYTAGLQEYVEALSFYHHLKHGGLVGWRQVQDNLTHRQKSVDKKPSSLEDLTIEEEATAAAEAEEKGEDGEVTVMVPRSDFMLGIADLTGEVMRQAVNSAGSGNTKLCFALLKFLQEIHDGFVSLTSTGNSHREIPKKVHVLQSSLQKVETVCYNINVRGTEVPKHLLGTYLELSKQSNFEGNHDDIDDI